MKGGSSRHETMNGAKDQEWFGRVTLWLVKLRKEQGLASAVNLAGPFIMSSQGMP